MNLETFLDKHLDKDVMDTVVYNFDGTLHRDPDYRNYKVLNSYKNEDSKVVFIVVQKKK